MLKGGETGLVSETSPFHSVPGLPGEVDQRPRTFSVASTPYPPPPIVFLTIQVEREKPLAVSSA